MKKILEVLYYGPNDIRFKTDFHPPIGPRTISNLLFDTTLSMATKLWGGDETSVLAMIRILAVADLTLSVNREEMLRNMAQDSEYFAKMFNEMTQEMVKHGEAISFGPGIAPPKGMS
jgi:hypothetical protein